MTSKKALHYLVLCGITILSMTLSSAEAKTLNAEVGGLFIPEHYSELVIVPSDISEVLIADPEIADVHVLGAKRVAFIGKKVGRTNAKMFDKQNHIIREFDVVVGYDLPGIRKALHNFLPHEHIGVELVNTNIALVGDISDASVADKAIKIVTQFMTGGTSGGAASPSGGTASAAATSPVLNLMKVISGQQVMLRVRVGEIQRNALKELGLGLGGYRGSATNGGVYGGSGGGQGQFSQITSSGSSTSGSSSSSSAGTTSTGSTASAPTFGSTIVSDSSLLTAGGILTGFLKNGEGGLSATLQALETQGLLKMLAEPNLVAMSGEKAEFLAGGEFPVPSVQVSSGSAPVESVTFQQYGVSVQFIPLVLSDNRIRLTVSPEVSQIDTSNETNVNGTTIPGLDTRRVKTTVELAPGESFMLAGLIQDSMNSSISQIPGASNIPILGALLRSTSYTRNETELVIAVTPYIVDPVKSSDIRLPTDDFRPATLMEQFFYGALASTSGNTRRLSQTPSLEGPLGFMTD